MGSGGHMAWGSQGVAGGQGKDKVYLMLLLKLCIVGYIPGTELWLTLGNL